MVHSPTSSDAISAFPNSKYSFFLRNYNRADDWLRQNGFSGLRPVPYEFQMQTALLPRPTSDTTLQAKQQSFPTVSPIVEKVIETPVHVPSTETTTLKKGPNFHLQDIPPSSLSIDEDYLRAVEVNRRHITERDRFKNNSNSNWDSSTQKGQAAKLNYASTFSSQVQYVDYCKMETYVTRSVAPLPLGPIKPVGHQQNTSTSRPSSETIGKRYSKNRNNNKGLSFTSSSWHEKLHEQSKRKLGPRGTDYDRLYGSGAKAASIIKARETELQVNFDRFSDRHQPKLWPQLPVRLNFNGQ